MYGAKLLRLRDQIESKGFTMNVLSTYETLMSNKKTSKGLEPGELSYINSRSGGVGKTRKGLVGYLDYIKSNKTFYYTSE
jgi:hypothetical protein